MSRQKKESASTFDAHAAELEEQIRRFDALTGASVKSGQMAAAVSAASKATELRRSLARVRNEIAAATVTDPVERLERLHRAAAADGSWIAAAKLHKELEIARDLQRRRGDLETEGMTDEQLLGIIVQAVASMTAQHLERLEDAIDLRRGGKVVRLAGSGA
jgi:hypothetical protein